MPKRSRVLFWIFVVLMLAVAGRLLFGQEPIQPTRGVFGEVQVITNALPAVSRISTTLVGPGGGATYYYWLVAKYSSNRPGQDKPAGNATPSLPTAATGAPLTLTGANYIHVCWNAAPDASGYDVLRTTTNALPFTGNFAVALNTASTCVDDQGAALQPYTLATYNPAKAPTSLKYARLDMPRISGPPENAPKGQCRLYVENSVPTFSAVDETGASCLAGGGAVGLCSTAAEMTQQINYYVSLTGDDSTGDGSAGNPWQHWQYPFSPTNPHMVPPIVCGKYTIHVDQGHYCAGDPGVGQGDPCNGAANGTVDADGIHIDGRIFAGGGVGGFNASAPPGGTYWPWESAWIEIVGASEPGTDDGGGVNDPNSYVFDMTAPCGGVAALSASGANLVLRGVKIRRGGYGVLQHGSQVKYAGSILENSCTNLDAGFGGLVYFDHTSGDDADFWCPFGGTYCTFLQLQHVPDTLMEDGGQWGAIIHDRTFVSDESPDDQGDSSNVDVHFAAPSPLISAFVNFSGAVLVQNASAMMNSWFNWGTDSINFGGGRGLFLQNGSYWAGQVEVNDTGGTGTMIPVTAESGSTFDCSREGSTRIVNVDLAFQIDDASTIVCNPKFISGVTDRYKSVPSASIFDQTVMKSTDTAAGAATLPYIVPFSTTPNFDWELGSVQDITLTGDVTSSTIANAILTGQQLTMIICQDGGGSHAFAWPANVQGADVIGSTGSKCNIQQFMFRSTDSKWYALGPMQKDQ